MGKLVVLFLLVSVLALSGCTTDKPYEQPTKVEQTTIQEITTTIQKIKTFNIGDTATDGQLKVTVNNVRYATKIDEKGNEYLVAEASEGKHYIIIDLTIENVLPNETQTISTFMNTEVIDTEGYTYSLDFTALTALDKSFKDGDLLPGMKKRGEIAFEVPTTANNLKFAFKFDLFGTTALFNI